MQRAAGRRHPRPAVADELTIRPPPPQLANQIRAVQIAAGLADGEEDFHRQCSPRAAAWNRRQVDDISGVGSMSNCASGEKLSSWAADCVFPAAFPDSSAVRRAQIQLGGQFADYLLGRLQIRVVGKSIPIPRKCRRRRLRRSRLPHAARRGRCETCRRCFRTVATGRNPSAASSSANCDPSASCSSSGSSSSRRVLVTTSSFGPL